MKGNCASIETFSPIQSQEVPLGDGGLKCGAQELQQLKPGMRTQKLLQYLPQLYTDLAHV